MSEKKTFKVIFDGFETLEQAQAFVGITIRTNEGVGNVFYDKTTNELVLVEAKQELTDEETREIIVPLNLYKK